MPGLLNPQLNILCVYGGRGLSADVDCLHGAAAAAVRVRPAVRLRVRHDDAHERLAGRLVPRVHRDRRERRVRVPVHVLAQLLVHVRELLP